MKYMNVARKFSAVVVGSAVVALPALAGVKEDVTAATTSGNEVVQLVVGGVIAIAALAFGLGMMKSWLSK
jgi:histidinol dehydrogenase